jgi:hypothetical protein
MRLGPTDLLALGAADAMASPLPFTLSPGRDAGL